MLKQGKDVFPPYPYLIPLALVVSIVLAIPFTSDFQNLFKYEPKRSDIWSWEIVPTNAWQGFNLLPGELLEIDVSKIKKKHDVRVYGGYAEIKNITIITSQGEVAYQVVGSEIEPRVFKTSPLTAKTFLEPVREGKVAGPILVERTKRIRVSPGQKVRIWANSKEKDERVLGYVVFFQEYGSQAHLIKGTNEVSLEHPSGFKWGYKK